MMDNYGTPPLGLVRGEGAVVYDEAGRSYVDLLAGIAVNVLGHAHPAIVAAVSKQVGTLGHVSNLFVAEPPVALAELLLALAGRQGRVFFGNSGAEAVEAAFKLSRLTGRLGVVATQGGFHGRTMGSLALTGQPTKADPFRPLPGDVTHVPYGDVAALDAAVTTDTAMVILEPIQGEAGVVVPPAGYLAAAREITAARGALLALDEVQTGVGRTGHWFAHQADGIEPDLVTLAKGLGGGLPIGACVAFGGAADLLGRVATPARSAATRSAAPRRSRSSRRSPTRACSTTSSAPASGSRPASRRSATRSSARCAAPACSSASCWVRPPPPRSPACCATRAS
ncbi:hypothetical protein Pflav_007370 [Phytohabitans flavus]|uniref:Acetylornithine aminotransferase n=1 Tax=Phytohabitans flavus TaxID=1076124 RepID=A0A6F8XKI8_9ACTN|nr:hypothetical protein Pflav_007370 [Phytohabitans flavus]